MAKLLSIVLALFLLFSTSLSAQTYTQAQALAVDAVFLARVQVAVSNAAIAISAEGAAPAFHTQRLAYAIRVLADSAGFAKQMATGIVSDGVDYGAGTDAALQTRVNAVWNAYAGAVP